MRRQLKLSTAAVALLGAALWMSAPAMANDEDFVTEGFDPGLVIVNDVDVSTEIVQFSEFSDVSTSQNNTANITDNVLQNASGNIGVNNAAGDGNVQANVTALSISSSGSTGPLDVNADISQAVFFGHDASTSTNNEAELEDNVLQNAAGHIGVNNAAGNGNVQANALSLGVVGGSQLVVARVTIDQFNAIGTNASTSTINEATLEDNVLQNASGDIGVNNASGDGNAQANATALATGANTAAAAGEISQFSFTLDASTSSTNPAIIEDNVLQNASGNAGVNNAAGDFNTQANGLAIAVAPNGLGQVVASVTQTSINFDSSSFNTNTALIQGNVAQNFKGNIGINNAAGTGNVQANLLVIASHP